MIARDNIFDEAYEKLRAGAGTTKRAIDALERMQRDEVESHGVIDELIRLHDRIEAFVFARKPTLRIVHGGRP